MHGGRASLYINKNRVFPEEQERNSRGNIVRIAEECKIGKNWNYNFSVWPEIFVRWNVLSLKQLSRGDYND